MEEQNSEAEKHLPELPFTYVRTEDPEKADYNIPRLLVRLPGESKELPSDEVMLKRVVHEKEGSKWYFSKEWREKGLPQEQIEFKIGDKKITVYNFNRDKQFTDEHIAKTSKVLSMLAQHFPKILDRIRWVLVLDKQVSSVYGDNKGYPLNGSTWVPWKAFKLQPLGMEFFPHRIIKATNFEGTLVHELSHIIDDEYFQEWRDKFSWQPVSYVDKAGWEIRKTPDSDLERPYNKKTGEMAPQFRIPLQPEQCVTDYAKISESEDFCESIVAYFYDPELLKRVSMGKFEIIKRHDAKKPVPKIEVKRIPKEQMKLPEIKPETVYYYVKEPTD